MARFRITTKGVSAGPSELKWGITTVGRAPDNDIVIEHPSVSSYHCELDLGLDCVTVRDSDSTNGTFINEQRVKEGRLQGGQSLRLGQVVAMVEGSFEAVHVPQLEVKKRPESVALGDGTFSCQNHPSIRAAWRCPRCQKFYCSTCIHDVHLRGRPSHQLCPVCSGPVEFVPWDGGKQKKKSLWGRIKKVFTVRIS